MNSRRLTKICRKSNFNLVSFPIHIQAHELLCARYKFLFNAYIGKIDGLFVFFGERFEDGKKFGIGTVLFFKGSFM